MLKEYCLVRFNRKSGKIDTTLEATGSAMLKLWAMRNCPRTKDIIIFDKESGEVAVYYEGTAKVLLPNISEDNLGNIEDYCPGLLRAVQ